MFFSSVASFAWASIHRRTSFSRACNVFRWASVSAITLDNAKHCGRPKNNRKAGLVDVCEWNQSSRGEYGLQGKPGATRPTVVLLYAALRYMMPRFLSIHTSSLHPKLPALGLARPA